MFIKKVALSLVLISSLVSSAYAQESNECAKLALAKTKITADLAKIQSNITELEEAHSSLNQLAKGAASASVSMAIAAIFRADFAAAEARDIRWYGNYKTTDALNSQLKKVGVKSLVVIGAAGVVGAIVVSTWDIMTYQNKVSQLKSEKIQLLQKMMAVDQMIESQAKTLNCN
jgi:hypothetical protein